MIHTAVSYVLKSQRSPENGIADCMARYKNNGEEWNFESLGLHDTMASKTASDKHSGIQWHRVVPQMA